MIRVCWRKDLKIFLTTSYHHLHLRIKFSTWISPRDSHHCTLLTILQYCDSDSSPLPMSSSSSPSFPPLPSPLTLHSHPTLLPTFFPSLPPPSPFHPLYIANFLSHPEILVIVIRRPHVSNAIDGVTAKMLFDTFIHFEKNPQWKFAILHGEKTFCAGADLQSIASASASSSSSSASSSSSSNPLIFPSSLSPIDHSQSIGPMGPTRLLLSKVVISSIEGWCVAGGLELSLWSDIRIAHSESKFGVFCRRWGVPLIDGGTIRLERAVGMSRAMDLILSGREISAQEGERIGLVNRVVECSDKSLISYSVLKESFDYAINLSRFPFSCLQADRLSLLKQSDFPSLSEKINFEFLNAMTNESLTRQMKGGAEMFAKGKGRKGNFGDFEEKSQSQKENTKTQMARTSSPSPSPSLSSILTLPPPSHRVVIFDLGGVIFPSPIESLVEYEKLQAIPPYSLNKFLMFSPSWIQLEKGQIGISTFQRDLDREISQSDVLRGKVHGKDIFESLTKALFQPRMAMLKCVVSLRERGFIVASITNNFKEKETDTDGHHFTYPHIIFPSMLYQSCTLNMRKPDREIFTYAVKDIQQGLSRDIPLTSDRWCFLDDIPHNLKEPKKMGMTTIRVRKDYKEAIEELEEWCRTGKGRGSQGENKSKL